MTRSELQQVIDDQSAVSAFHITRALADFMETEQLAALPVTQEDHDARAQLIDELSKVLAHHFGTVAEKQTEAIIAAAKILGS